MNDVPAALAELDLPDATADAVGARTLRLSRCWPRSGGRLGLEFESHDGARVAGQWFADADDLGRIAAATAPSGPVHVVPEANVVLQPSGADRRLEDLARLAGDRSTDLVVHRPERRAVLRRYADGAVHYLKVVAPDRVGRLTATAATAAGWHAIATPRLIGVDRRRGVTVWSELPGVPFHTIVGTTQAVAVAHATGRLLRRLHDLPVPASVSAHGPREEAEVVLGWFAHARAYVPSVARDAAQAVAAIQRRLQGDVARPVLLHRDLHDKQVLVDGGRVGLLDLDTLACGDAALDLANLVAHLELRHLQGRCRDHAPLVEALVDGYSPDRSVEERLPLYLTAARLRLALVYAFRPGWRSATAALAA